MKRPVFWNVAGRQAVSAVLQSPCLGNESPLWKRTRPRWRWQTWVKEPVTSFRTQKPRLQRILNRALGTTQALIFYFFTNWLALTTHARVSSPVVTVPGVGQIGQGLQNTWGLEEDEEHEEESSGEGEVVKMEEEQQEKDKTAKGFCLFFYHKVTSVLRLYRLGNCFLLQQL